MTATYGDARRYAGLGEHRPERSRFGQAIGRLLRRLDHYLEERRRYRQTLDELDGLTDRELADIGVARWQIPEVARQAASAEARI